MIAFASQWGAVVALVVAIVTGAPVWWIVFAALVVVAFVAWRLDKREQFLRHASRVMAAAVTCQQCGGSVAGSVDLPHPTEADRTVRYYHCANGHVIRESSSAP